MVLIGHLHYRVIFTTSTRMLHGFLFLIKFVIPLVNGIQINTNYLKKESRQSILVLVLLFRKTSFLMSWHLLQFSSFQVCRKPKTAENVNITSILHVDCPSIGLVVQFFLKFFLFHGKLSRNYEKRCKRSRRISC